MIVLVTGGHGKLGSELTKVFPHVLGPMHEEMDITKKDVVFDYIKKHNPDILIHCAALTGVNQCEENKELAWKTNVLGTENLINACLNFNPDCYFIYVSTACVFHGDRGNYSENDIPYPKNFYSLTKLLGEFVVRKLKNYLVIRTNFVARDRWLYSKAFKDRFGTYLFADDLANAIKEVINKGLKDIVHVCGEEKLSMFDLAKITTSEILPMTLDEYSGPPLTIDMSLVSERTKTYLITK